MQGIYLEVKTKKKAARADAMIFALRLPCAVVGKKSPRVKRVRDPRIPPAETSRTAFRVKPSLKVREMRW
jgi:hypothetical protein